MKIIFLFVLFVVQNGVSFASASADESTPQHPPKQSLSQVDPNPFFRHLDWDESTQRYFYKHTPHDQRTAKQDKMHLIFKEDVNRWNFFLKESVERSRLRSKFLDRVPPGQGRLSRGDDILSSQMREDLIKDERLTRQGLVTTEESTRLIIITKVSYSEQKIHQKLITEGK